MTAATQPEQSGEFSRATRAADFILSQTELRPRVALVLGSGLGALADDLDDAVRIPYAGIPGFPQPTAEGHAGQLVIGKLPPQPAQTRRLLGAPVEGVAVAAMQGRVHLYEGLPLKDVIFPIRVFGRMGIRAIILTNAAGGISPRFEPGSLAVLEDHINLQGSNPLAGPNDERFGPRFPDMSNAYHPPYRELALAAGRRLGLKIATGVYAAMTGPSYETPAEIRFLRAIGADLVGMSTVAEAITARHQGMRVLAISCVTNKAAGIRTGPPTSAGFAPVGVGAESPATVDSAFAGAEREPITHEEVLETGLRLRAQFTELLRAVVPAIEADVAQAL